MNTVLVVYSNQNLSLKEINNRKLPKYAFRTKEELKVGDILKSPNYSSNMIVTDIIEKDFQYFNASTGEMFNEISSTKAYPIKELVLREDNENLVYCKKQEQE